MFDDILSSLGLTEGEVKIYEYLLAEGEKTAGQVIKNVYIKRGSAYNYLKSLISKGLIKQEIKNKVAIFRANHPNALKEYQDRQIAEASQAKTVLESSLANIISTYNLAYNRPTVTYFEGKDGIEKIYDDTLLPSNSQEIFVFRFHLDDQVLGGKFFNGIQKKRAKAGIHTRIISPTEISQKTGEEDTELLKERRHWPDLSIPAEIDIYENKVAFISFENPPVGTIIENTAIAMTLRQIFEKVWKSLPKTHSSNTPETLA